MISISIIISITFMMMKHPLSMGLILMMQTLMTSLISGNHHNNMWYSYILFLIMVGGMLVLFIYMTSIASNEKFHIKLKIKHLLIMLPLMMTFTPMIDLKNNETIMHNMSQSMILSFNKFINWPLNMITLMLMIYLLITLIATVKISLFKMGPIRQMNN